MNTSGFLVENDTHLKDPLSASVNGAFQRGPRESSNGDEYGLWETASRLTVSFPREGTKISRYESTLYETFGHLLTEPQLQDNILKAFQTWAQHSSINVGLVSDSGDDFGIGGATQGDLRFGDSRIGAVPMAGDVFAVAVPHNDLMTGTWAGDILFNSNAEWVDTDQFFAVALHEIGHVLGLEHSTDPILVMHPTALNQTLSAGDIMDIKSLYGNRALDQYDLDGNNNDTMESAVEIRNTGSVDGIIPLAVFGDIGGPADVDFFSIRPNSGYNGSITFQLISKGLSIVRGRLTVLDWDGNEFGSVTESSTTGSDIEFQLNNVDDSQHYFVKVESLGNSENRFGSYGLETTIDGNVMQGEDLMETAIRRNYGFLSQGDVQELFLNDLNTAAIQDDLVDEFGNNLHTNDTAATATILEQSPNAAAHNDYRVQGSISDETDVDFYRFEALSSTMMIRINAMEPSGLISDIRVFDSSLNPVSGQVKVNGNGELLVEFPGIIPEDEYFVSVTPDQPGLGFDAGNYDLNIAFNAAVGSLATLGTGRLSTAHRTEAHTLYVARTQLFHFALTGMSQSITPNATVWMTVYDEDGNAKYRVATRPNETRTSQSVILRPGSYSIRVHLTLPTSVDRRPSLLAVPLLNYRIDGAGISDPIGPEIIDPLEDPFSPCDKSNSRFCYPNDRFSVDPFIVVEEDEVTLPGTVQNPNWMDANSWYWETDWLR